MLAQLAYLRLCALMSLRAYVPAPLCRVSDGTAVNTGHVGGVIRMIKLHVSRP